MHLSYPVLVSKTAGIPYVAELLDGPDLTAVGETASKVCQKLERRLKRLSKHVSVNPSSTWKSIEIFCKAFPIQPMYMVQGRRHLAGPSVQFPVRYARMVDEKDGLYCLLPDLEEQFYCPDERIFMTMLTDTVRSMTATMSPEQVWKFWPPSEQEIRWIRIRTEPLGRSFGGHSRLKILPTVADPLIQKANPFVTLTEHSDTHAALQDSMSSNGCILIGETGVGKTAMLLHVARLIQRRDHAQRKAESKSLGLRASPRRPLFWMSSGGRLIAGMQYLGQWQARLEGMIAELSDSGASILFENLRDLLTLGSGDSRDSLGAFMLPYLRSGQLRLIAEATPQELDACRRLLPAFIDALPHIRMPSVLPQSEMELLETLLERDAKNRKSTFSDDLPSNIQRWSAQFQRQASSPGPAVDFLRSLLAKKPAHLDSSMAIASFLKRTGLPEVLIRHNMALTREEVAEHLQSEVIGQVEACWAAAGLVTRIKSSMNDSQRPFGCMLLCGPTGVGKTQLAKSLARYLFGNSEAKLPLVRLDMSEFAGVAVGHRFLLDGNGQPADWIQQIRLRPLSVLLFDEIEKAGSEVFDILLSLLDEGRLTDRMGRTTSFRNTLVLMTSNIGGTLNASAGFGESRSPNYLMEVRRAFRPEFFNRLDQIIAFDPLSPEVIAKITKKELAEISRRDGIVRQGLQLEFSDRLIAHLSRVGFDARLGARPLQRAIESQVVAPLAKWLLTEVTRSNRIVLDWNETGLIIGQ